MNVPLPQIRAPASKPGECLRAGIPARWMVVKFCASLRETTSVKDFTVVDRVIKNCSTNLWKTMGVKDFTSGFKYPEFWVFMDVKKGMADKTIPRGIERIKNKGAQVSQIVLPSLKLRSERSRSFRFFLSLHSMTFLSISSRVMLLRSGSAQNSMPGMLLIPFLFSIISIFNYKTSIK